MRTVVRWLVMAVAVLVIVAMVAYARGRTHHRGDDVGAFPADRAAYAARVVAGL